MFNRIAQALFGTATEGQRKAALGFYFGAILAVALFGCVLAIALMDKPTITANLESIAQGALEAMKFVIGALMLGYVGEYAGNAAKAIGGNKGQAPK